MNHLILSHFIPDESGKKDFLTYVRLTKFLLSPDFFVKFRNSFLLFLSVPKQWNPDHGSRKNLVFTKDKIQNLSGEGIDLNELGEGFWVYRYEDGTPGEKGVLLHDCKMGHWIAFNQSGEKIREGSFIHGQPCGKWKKYYPGKPPYFFTYD